MEKGKVIKIGIGILVATGGAISVYLKEKFFKESNKGKIKATKEKLCCGLCGLELEDNNKNSADKIYHIHDDLEMDRNFLFLYTKNGILNKQLMEYYGDICECCCKKIRKEYEKANELEKEYQIQKDNIIEYSINYQGEIPYNPNAEFYETQYYEDKEDSWEEIRRYAVMKHRNTIVNFDKEIYAINQMDNYTYKIWKATGRII